MRPFQGLGHLVERACELIQLPRLMGKTGAHAQLPSSDSFRRFHECLNLADDKQVSAQPGCGERECSDEDQRRKIAGENLVDASKSNGRRDANAHVRVRACSAAERRERKEPRVPSVPGASAVP